MPDDPELPDEAKFLRIRHVIEKTSLSRATLYRLMTAHKFPRPFKVGYSALWLESDVNKWVNSVVDVSINQGRRRRS